MFTKMLKKKLLTQAAVLTAPLLLVGCSSVPDAVNPVEWYRSSVEYFSDDEADMTADGNVQNGAEQKNVGSGFVAAQAPEGKYGEPIMRQGEVVNPLGEEKTAEVVQAPAPKAAPSTPVSSQSLESQKPVVIANGVPESSPTTPKLKLTPPTTTAQPVGQTDTRSVSEIYAANIAQTRPDQNVTTMGRNDTLAYGMHPYETVVVSSTGVDRQVPSYMQPAQQQRYASLTQTVQSDAYDTLSSAMMIEPPVVVEGRAQSLSSFNPSLFNGSFQVATIQFGNGSAKLTQEDIRILKEVVSIHQQQGGVIRVVGHASSRTQNMSVQKHETVNAKMSMGRADRVARQLLSLGLPGEHLFVGGVSDHQPLYQEVMPSGEAGNRRTEIFVDY